MKNSIVIEQDVQEARDAFAVSANSNLRGIRLIEAKVSGLPAEAATGPVAPDISFSPDEAHADVEGLFLSVDFSLVLHDRGARDLQLAAFECSFRLDYELNPAFTLTETQIAAFHRGNAIFNCWPFFREFAQNTLLRMAYPPPPIPFLRLMPKRPQEEKSAAPQAKPHTKRQVPPKARP